MDKNRIGVAIGLVLFVFLAIFDGLDTDEDIANVQIEQMLAGPMLAKKPCAR